MLLSWSRTASVGVMLLLKVSEERREEERRTDAFPTAVLGFYCGFNVAATLIDSVSFFLGFFSIYHMQPRIWQFWYNLTCFGRGQDSISGSKPSQTKPNQTKPLLSPIESARSCQGGDRIHNPVVSPSPSSQFFSHTSLALRWWMRCFSLSQRCQSVLLFWHTEPAGGEGGGGGVEVAGRRPVSTFIREQRPFVTAVGEGTQASNLIIFIRLVDHRESSKMCRVSDNAPVDVNHFLNC